MEANDLEVLSRVEDLTAAVYYRDTEHKCLHNDIFEKGLEMAFNGICRKGTIIPMHWHMFRLIQTRRLEALLPVLAQPEQSLCELARLMGITWPGFANPGTEMTLSEFA